ncbi:hypothetical protein AUJ14_01665 [Candidatus Micrarchaeota archaeon CG1_02_55_22]|nr:MAG: hypothetical protein AUJ14_01665 [Candidatus Micrarchaeota archaeon CG1_02_55_22]
MREYTLFDLLFEIALSSVIWLVKLPIRALRYAWSGVFDGFPALYRAAVNFYRWLVQKYYQLFPGALRAKERKEKAELLITFEELVKKREELKALLDAQAEMLEELALKIWNIDEAPFRRRFQGRSAQEIMDSYDVSELWPYEKIQAVAIEYEKTLFRIFTAYKKLQLYGIDRGITQIEGK